MAKIKVTQEIADAIEILKQENSAPFEIGMKIILGIQPYSNHKLDCLENIGALDFANMFINGHEIEKTPYSMWKEAYDHEEIHTKNPQIYNNGKRDIMNWIFENFTVIGVNG